jgi:AcrR family transcriptional regulator
MSEGGRKLLSRPERQQAILRGAAAAFAAKGYAATSMEEVAAASGITKEIVYRNFESKAELYRGVLERTAQELRDEFAARAQDAGFGAGVRATLAVGRAHPDALRLLLVHAAREVEFADYAREMRARVVERVMRLSREPDPVLRRWTAEAIVEHLYDAVLLWLEVGDPARDEEFAERCIAGIEALRGAWSSAARRRA